MVPCVFGLPGHPAGVLIRGQYDERPIEDWSPGDPISSWSPERRGRPLAPAYVTKNSYDDAVVTVTAGPDERTVRISPDFPVSVRWAGGSRTAHVTYLLDRGGRFSIGATPIGCCSDGGNLPSLSAQLGFQFGELTRMWVLKVHGSEKAATQYLGGLAQTYSLPTHRGIGYLRSNSQAVADTANASRCLEEHGRCLDLPLCSGALGTADQDPHATDVLVHAANLLPLVMSIRIADERHPWATIWRTESTHYRGDFYRLSVQGGRGYIANRVLLGGFPTAAAQVESLERDPSEPPPRDSTFRMRAVAVEDARPAKATGSR